ncbi:MAG TPA: archaellin/type IV pilin N-terminal domain-containing protein [Dehalococcoidia bacterium]|nr:archaellin/type IV pilin N-terminal domain-containing protein [Dehalococcoidia bacterium]
MVKVKKMLRGLAKGQRGITGLETAIILIAFVIVASVFAFVTLSTGLFSAERSKETIFAGLQKAQSNLELHGSVVVTGADVVNQDADPNAPPAVGDAQGGTLTFQLALAAGGSPISLDRNAGNSRVVMNYTDADGRIEDLDYSANNIVGDGDQMLEPGELFTVTIEFGTAYTGSVNTNQSGIILSPNERFTIEVVAPAGGSMLIARTMPPAIDPVVDLH